MTLLELQAQLARLAERVGAWRVLNPGLDEQVVSLTAIYRTLSEHVVIDGFVFSASNNSVTGFKLSGGEHAIHGAHFFEPEPPPKIAPLPVGAPPTPDTENPPA